MNVADLRPVDLFEDCTDAELEPWAAVTEELRFAPGEQISETGDDSRGLVLLLEGTVQMFIHDGEHLEPRGDNVAPTWIGAIASLTEAPVGVRMTARTDVRLGIVPGEHFASLTRATPSVFRRIMRQVRPVMGRMAAWEQNRERLASLGTMAAGLAHELNNPAAAATRSAAELTETFKVLSSTMSAFVEAGVERADAEKVVSCMQEAVARAQAQDALSAIDAADAEDELLDVLEDHGIPDAYRLTEPLAAAGIDREWLERTAVHAGSALPAALAWIAASVTAVQLTAELTESTARMSGLVGAIKSYAYMDRGGVVEVDIREGLETTLKVLKHKYKHTQIQIDRRYADDLPKITVHGSALNQVWTNLIDNAIDALGDTGTITIAAVRDGGCIRVDVTDDGPGIPADVIDKVFDPFFTTKGVGQGTGLGLETAARIVRVQHNGSLTVDSAPGRTVFHVWLPV